MHYLMIYPQILCFSQLLHIASCAIASGLTDVFDTGDLLKNGGNEALTAQGMVDAQALLPNTEARTQCDSFCMYR